MPGEEVPRSDGGGGACDGGSAAAGAWTAEARQALLLVCKGRCGKGSKLNPNLAFFLRRMAALAPPLM